MDNEREQEVQGEKSEAEGYPVQEIGGERPRPWSGPSHSCPEPADALATDEEEMTKADIQDEDLTVVGTTKETEEVEAGGTEGEAEETEAEAEETEGEAEELEAEAEETEAEAEETEAEAEETEAEAEETEAEAEETEGEAEELEAEAEETEAEAEETEGEAEETEAEEVESGVQEAPENSQSEPGSQPSPLEGTEVLQKEVLHPATPTNGTAGQEKVSFRKRRNAKPGDRASTQRTPPPFHLQDFSFKIATRYYMALLFLLLVSTVNSNPIPARTTSTSAHPHTPHGGYIGSGGQCALCLDRECATHVSRICKGDDFIWPNRMLGIENCSKDNLKPDEPCQLTNGSLVVQSDQPLSFEGEKAFPSETVPCAGLDLPPGPKFTPAPLVNTTGSTTTPDTRNSGAIIGGILGGVAIGVFIIFLIVWKCGERLDGTGPQNAVPPGGNTGIENEMSPLQGQANGNVTQGPGNDGESAM